jgi:hypothetical protein
MLDIGLIAASALVGAIVFRLRGGWLGGWPGDRPITITVWSALLTAPLWFLAPWWAVLGALVLTFGATTMGHGSGLDFGRVEADDPDELWRHHWAPNDDPMGDAKFMAVRGLLMTLPVGIALVMGGHYTWATVGLSGVLMGPAYWVGYLYWKATQGNKRLLPAGAEAGEWLTGLLVAGVCAVLWFAIV